MPRNERLLAVTVTALALSGCLGPRVFRDIHAPQYPPTDPDTIQVLESVPPDAIVLGDVEGVGAGWGMIFHPDALTNARKGAAQLGADAMVIEAQGSEALQGDLFGRDMPNVRVKALRLSR